MVKIRLFRTGAKKKPTYRVVVADARAPRNGRFIEVIGNYNPRTKPVEANIQEDRALYWLSVGAQPTDTVNKILKNLGTLDRFAQVKKGAALEEVLATATQEKATQGKAKPKKEVAAVAPVAEEPVEAPAIATETTAEAVAEVSEAVPAEVAEEVSAETSLDEDES